jgi:tetratricopeptide (TPR) repeat protein
MNVLITEAQRHIEAGRLPAARRAAQVLLEQQPELAEGWLLLALAEQRLQHHEAMLEAVREAARIQPDNTQVALKLAEALLLCGSGAEARATLASLEARAAGDARLLTAIAALYTSAGAHQDRLRCTRGALALAPDEPALLGSCAAAETACGLIHDAEQHLDELLARKPNDYGSYYRRSILRQQHADRNHVAELTSVLASLPAQSADIVPLCYALAKEYEDQACYLLSFSHLRRGAARRRRGMTYQVADDEAAMRAIIAAFDAQRMAALGTVGQADAAPIFVTGLPRSGTTLVDRILSSHSAVHSLGEINDLAYAIIKLTGGVDESAEDPPNRLKQIGRAARLDFTALGRDYLARVAGYSRDKPRFIDKTPWNFLYFGLIALALPQARIIHLRRNPMDSCFALYKTLFRGGSPYSYDLGDLARYYLAYHALMQHWRQVLPGHFLEVDYEQLVQSPDTATRAVLDWCGLDFEPQCLEFHRNAAPAATASAAQVREPIHTRSVMNWKHYATELQPLALALQTGGLLIDEPD